jgi:signal transduction histidine kinase
VIAALRAASLTLERYGENLDPNDRRTLRSGFTRELARLEHLIEPPAPPPPQDFVVDDALRPVIAAEREAGLAVQSTLNGLRAHGRPEDLATVVHNLLVNARRHAPGSPVVIRAEHAGSDLRIYAEDCGPGIPPAERDSVFERGARGATTTCGPGSGLGLYVARTLMKEQGGEIDIADRPGGGASFVLTMPAATEAPIGAT